jgi:N-acetylglucosaminyl-diphospho-decaprenol L-rhamnosyltransferase
MRNSTERHDDVDVTIIIVSYNTREMTIACINSILEQTSSIRYEIIVVDNNSNDESAEVIRTNFPHIELIPSRENLGFGRANNLAAMHARGRRLLLLNPDTVILDHAIDKLYEFAVSNPKCGIWGGRTVFADGSLNPQSCWRRMTLWSLVCNATGLNTLKESNLFNPEGYGGWKRDTVRAVDIVVGCFFLIDKDLWEKLRGFDPVFFMYGEEADLCLRARRLGACPTVTPAASIIHYGGASETDKTDQRIKVLASKVTLVNRHWSKSSALAGRLLFLMIPLVRLVAYETLSVLLSRRFQRNAQTWREVLRSRDRWINGWSDVAATSPNDIARSTRHASFERSDAGTSDSADREGKVDGARGGN